MSDLAIRTALREMLEDIPDLGPVHDYQRHERTNKDFRELFVVDDVVKGWYMTRSAVDERTFTDSVNEEILTWELRGYRSLVDDRQSEITFATQLDLIRAAIRADKTLKGAVITHVVDGRSGLQVERIHPVMFAGLLCHEAQCSLKTVRYIEVPPDEADPHAGHDNPTTVFVGYSPDVGLKHRDKYVDLATGNPPPPLEEE